MIHKVPLIHLLLLQCYGEFQFQFQFRSPTTPQHLSAVLPLQLNEDQLQDTTSSHEMSAQQPKHTF